MCVFGGRIYLVQDIKQTVVHILLCVDGTTIVVLVGPTIVLYKKVFEGHHVLLLIGHHQLVVEAKQNELRRKQWKRSVSVLCHVMFAAAPIRSLCYKFLQLSS